MSVPLKESREDKWRFEGILIIRYLAQNEKATLIDTSKEFRRSKDTVKERIRYVKDLVSLGYFSENPAFEQELKKDLEKVSKKHEKKSSKVITDQKVIKLCLRKALVKK